MQAVQDNFIGCLSLSIGLRIRYRSEPSLTSQFIQIISNFAAVKLSTVVKYHCSRDIKSGDDAFPNEFTHFRSDDLNKNLSLHPFGEVIHGHKEIFALTSCFGEWSQNVHTLCSEGQEAEDGGE